MVVVVVVVVMVVVLVVGPNYLDRGGGANLPYISKTETGVLGNFFLHTLYISTAKHFMVSLQVT